MSIRYGVERQEFPPPPPYIALHTALEKIETWADADVRAKSAGSKKMPALIPKEIRQFIEDLLGPKDTRYIRLQDAKIKR